jgi:hypothetical protein
MRSVDASPARGGVAGADAQIVRSPAQGIAGAAREWTDAAVVLGILLLGATLGFIQESPRRGPRRSAIGESPPGKQLVS